MWDPATGDCTAVLSGHTVEVNGALLLADGQILSWSDDKTLRVWDPSSGVSTAILEGHTHGARGAMSLSNGRVLSWAGFVLGPEDEDCPDHTLRVWDAKTGACTAVLQGHANDVTGVLLLSDGRILTWSGDKTLRMWDVANGACTAVMQGHMDGVRGALSLSDGRIVSWTRFTGFNSADLTLRVWDAETRVAQGISLGDSKADLTLRVWDAETGACTAVLQGHTDVVTGALSLPDDRILSWSRDETLRMWDAATGVCVEIVSERELPLRHPDWLHYRHIVTRPGCVAENWSADASVRTVQMYHNLGFTPLPMWQAESDSLACLLRPDGTLVVTQANGQVGILKLYYGRKRVTLAEAEQLVSRPRLSTS